MVSEKKESAVFRNCKQDLPIVSISPGGDFDKILRRFKKLFDNSGVTWALGCVDILQISQLNFALIAIVC